MRAVAALLLVLAGAAGVLEQKQLTDRKLLDQLAHLFPPGTVFSPKEGTPPHFSAYVTDPASGRQTLAGFAFWTTEIEPLERGYDGPIKILVGMDTRGILTGVLVVEHREPYGDFSIDPPQFAAQFKGKDIRHPFRVGDDIDAVSRASISVTSATRAIRNSARRVARALLTPAERVR